MNDSAHSDAERAGQNDRAKHADHEDLAGMTDQPQPVLFFDGVCGLCNRFIDLMLRADNQDRFRYAPLQGDTARRMLGLLDQGQARGLPTGNRETADRPLGNRETADLPLGNSQNGEPQARGPDSFVYLEKGKRYEQSSAVLLALSRLGGPWRLTAVLFIIPRPLRDLVYRIVARNRYRWFGRRDECRLPTSEERERFLP